MKSFLAFALVLAWAAPALAIPSLPGELTKVDAEYRCEKPGGGVAFSLPRGKNAPRVWQTEPGEEIGLELEVVEFRRLRCPGCFDFTARLGADFVTYAQVRIPATEKRSVLDYYVVEPQTGERQLIDTFPCVQMK